MGGVGWRRETRGEDVFLGRGGLCLFSARQWSQLGLPLVGRSAACPCARAGEGWGLQPLTCMHLHIHVVRMRRYVETCSRHVSYVSVCKFTRTQTHETCLAMFTYTQTLGWLVCFRSEIMQHSGGETLIASRHLQRGMSGGPLRRVGRGAAPVAHQATQR